MKSKKVLIVDDNALNRKVFENIIGHNYLFETATNGLEAIEKIKEQDFDVILMDIQMPKLDGISALKIIRDDHLTGAPIIAISAYSDKGDRDYFLSAGFDEFIAKPVKPKDLLEIIYYYINKIPPLNYEKPEIQQTDLDESVISQLRKYNSEGNIRTVYMDFMEEAERLLEEIKILINNKDYVEIGEKLHILKGNSGTLGAQKLFNFAAFFEKKIKNSNYDGILEDNLVLKQHLDGFKNHLKNKKIF